MGIESLTFNYEGVHFVIGTRQITTTEDGRSIDTSPFLLFPAKVTFPSGQWSAREQFCFDGGKGIFLGMLVEDDEMARHYPEEYAKATRTIDEMLAWTKKWDGYRLEMSKVFEWLMTEEFSSLRYRRAAHQEQVL